jgi:hypothetical protein
LEKIMNKKYQHFTRMALIALPLVIATAGISSAQQATPAPLPRSGEFTLIATLRASVPTSPGCGTPLAPALATR